jgi:hypothetical protein
VKKKPRSSLGGSFRASRDVYEPPPNCIPTLAVQPLGLVFAG